MTSEFPRRWAGIALLAGCSLAHALTPLTPQLTNESRQELLMRLGAAGFPEVGQNSVLIGITSALGFEVRENAYSSDMPYPQLPKIEARSTPHSPGCAQLTLVASYAPPAEPMRTRLRGIYCLVGPAQWQAREQLLD